MIRVMFTLAIFALAGCGADGPPITPSVNTTVSVGGEGLRTSTGVTVQKGPITVGARF